MKANEIIQITLDEAESLFRERGWEDEAYGVSDARGEIVERVISRLTDFGPLEEEGKLVRIVKALEPFARAAKSIDDQYRDYSDHIYIFRDLTHGDFRAAMSAILDCYK